VRSITNVLAQCRFHRISKMTSSNPHPTSPPLSDSLHSLAHLPPSSRFPFHLPLEPFHITFLSLSLSLSRSPPQECVLPLLYIHPILPTRPRYPPLSSAFWPILSYRPLFCDIFFFILPSSISLSSLTNYRRTQFQWIKAAAAYYRRSVVPTRRTRIPTNRNADGLRYRRGV